MISDDSINPNHTNHNHSESERINLLKKTSGEIILTLVIRLHLSSFLLLVGPLKPFSTYTAA